MTLKSLYELDEPTHSPVGVGDKSAADYLQAMESLAAWAGEEGCLGLQDASLLLLEKLAEWQDGDAKPAVEAINLLDAWPRLAKAYRQQPQMAIPEIMELLRHPALALPLTDEEFGFLENQLQEDAANRTQSDPAKPAQAAEGKTALEFLAAMESLAGQLGQEGFQGLQDACLLLVEKLGEWQDAAPGGEAAMLLEAWPGMVEAYRQAPKDAICEIMGLLRDPTLGLPLTGEEFDFLESQLMEDAERLAEPLPALPAEAEESAPADYREGLQSLPPKARELIELLLMQAELVEAKLQAIASGDPLSAAEESQEIREHLERFASAAQTVGFSGLAQMCEFVDANIAQFLVKSPAFGAIELGLLGSWLAAAKNYLAAFTDAGAAQRLADRLQNPQWPVPLPPEDLVLLLARMKEVDIGDWSKDEEAGREKAATEADVSLALPDDVNQELLDILLQELPVQAQQLSEAMQNLQAEGSLQDIDVAQRIAHTLKGSANTVGIRGVAVLTHQLEDILMACAKAQKLPGGNLLNALIDATDCLEAMSDALLGQGEPPPHALAVLQTVLDWANRIDREGLPAQDEQAPQPKAPSGTEQMPAEAEAPAASAAAAVRVSAELVENLFRLSGESIILNGQAQERLRRMKAQLQAMQTQFELLQQLGAELETLIDLKDLTGRTSSGASQEFDALEMDQYNELHTASRRMVEAAVDAREFSLDARKEMDFMDELLDYQQSLVIDTQSTVMQTKLVPIGSILPRLQRSLRQTCRLTGKHASLSLSGGQLMVDGDTLNTLITPLMHILRNAVDHGIEGEDERQTLGKPAEGKIVFEFEAEGDNILVRCRDDGRGLDYGAIRDAAERRGALQPGQAVSEEELQRFILQPHFSTRTQSTQVSGRGVGMDVVRAQVVAMGGSLALRSTPGRGLTVDLRVPLPLSRSHALLAQVGAYRLVISNKGLNQVFYSQVGEMLELAGETRLLLEGAVYPLFKLSQMLRIPEHRHEQRPPGAILLVQNEDQLAAVLVDSIIDSRDVVVKSLGYYIEKIPGVVGATILGDGAVTPVIDVPELLRAPARSIQDAELAALEADEEADDTPMVLVVDDSLSNRRALEQLLGDAGFMVRTAHDGVEAAELLPQIKPAIVLTDLEMPRMNGIELSAHIRAQASTRKLPVIMITSRTTQRHRKLAEEAGVNFYLTKPVREDDLLEKINSLLSLVPEQEA